MNKVTNNLTGKTYNSLEDMWGDVGTVTDEFAKDVEEVFRKAYPGEKISNMNLSEQMDILKSSIKSGNPYNLYPENYVQKMFIAGFLLGHESKDKDLIESIADGNIITAFENAKKLMK
jgi:ribosome-binding protein aMBF1 (putative translation factor)